MNLTEEKMKEALSGDDLLKIAFRNEKTYREEILNEIYPYAKTFSAEFRRNRIAHWISIYLTLIEKAEEMIANSERDETEKIKMMDPFGLQFISIENMSKPDIRTNLLYEGCYIPLTLGLEKKGVNVYFLPLLAKTVKYMFEVKNKEHKNWKSEQIMEMLGYIGKTLETKDSGTHLQEFEEKYKLTKRKAEKPSFVGGYMDYYSSFYKHFTVKEIQTLEVMFHRNEHHGGNLFSPTYK